MNIWNDSVSMGDALCTFPGTLALAKRRQREGHDVAILWTNEAVGQIFPHEKYGLSRTTIDGPTERISIHDMVYQAGLQHAFHLHPTAQFMAFIGFPDLAFEPRRPEVAIPDTASVEPDIVIAPYILAEICRMWPLDRWQIVIDGLRRARPQYSIAVLAGTKLPTDADAAKIAPWLPGRMDLIASFMRHDLRGVDYIVDQPLGDVARILANARLAVTVDTGPARLKHAVGGQHLLLANNLVPLDWATYPGCRTLYRPLADLQPDDVLTHALSML